jgi:hypothetical protein
MGDLVSYVTHVDYGPQAGRLIVSRPGGLKRTLETEQNYISMTTFRTVKLLENLQTSQLGMEAH